MPVIVEVEPEAQKMLLEADDRWVAEHGYLATNPLLNEFADAIERLGANPELGKAVRRGRARPLRRLLLDSGWHVYYRYRADLPVVEIVAIWFASRGSSPPL